MPEHVKGSEGVYVVDTRMFGVEEQTAAFVIDADRPVVVDTGLESDAPRVVEAVEEIGIDREDVEYVVVTHVHLDHAGGVGVVADAFPNATFVVHDRGVNYLVDDESAERLVERVHEAVGPLADAYGGIETIPRERVAGVSPPDTVDLGDRALELVKAEGHAPHHFALYDDRSRSLFVIDEGCAYIDGRELPTTPPPDFDLDETLESFDRFEEYDAEAVLYGHYGVNYDGAEAIPRHREALVSWVDEVRNARKDNDQTEAIIESVLENHPEAAENDITRQVMARDVRGVLGYLSRDGP
jgi:glyoxylase-like metal-dependent hydrolase (beta-lactamase superfamily II)